MPALYLPCIGSMSKIPSIVHPRLSELMSTNRHRLENIPQHPLFLSPPQTEALCDSQPSQAPGGGGAAGEPAGERLQHQPDAAVLAEPALLQPQRQGDASGTLSGAGGVA